MEARTVLKCLVIGGLVSSYAFACAYLIIRL